MDLSTPDPVYTSQRKAIRIMSFKGNEVHCDDLLKNLNILSVEKKRDLLYARFLWLCQKDLLPKCISEYFKPNRIRRLATLRERET